MHNRDASSSSLESHEQTSEKQATRRERDRSWHMAYMSHFLPSLAHEIKNPLAGMQSIVEVLLEEIQGVQHREDLELLLYELSRLRFLIDRMTLVEMSVLNSANIVDLVQVAQRSIKLASKRAYQLGINMESSASMEPMWAHINPEGFHIILLNLLNNAIEACSKGDEISIRLSRKDDMVYLCVKDTGKGMSEEVQKQATEPFFTTKPSGSGIGLALIASFVERGGGSLSIQSQEGVGTAISVSIKDVAFRASSDGASSNPWNTQR